MRPLLVLWSLGCADAPTTAEPVALPVAAERTTFASAEALGAYVLEARTQTTTTPAGGEASVVEETTRLRWRDDEHWQYVRERGGERLSETLVWEGEVYKAGRSGERRRSGDSEVARMELGQQADPWARTLGPLSSRVSLTEAGEEIIETRRVHRYALGLTPESPAGGSPRKARTVSGVEGQVWIDEATAVRLAGELVLTTETEGTVTQKRLRFSMSALGGDPAVPSPEAAP